MKFDDDWQELLQEDPFADFDLDFGPGEGDFFFNEEEDSQSFDATESFDSEEKPLASDDIEVLGTDESLNIDDIPKEPITVEDYSLSFDEDADFSFEEDSDYVFSNVDRDSDIEDDDSVFPVFEVYDEQPIGEVGSKKPFKNSGTPIFNIEFSGNIDRDVDLDEVIKGLTNRLREDLGSGTDLRYSY